MASSLSLAVLEVLANLGVVRNLDDYVFVVAEFSDNLVSDFDDESQPIDVHSCQTTQVIGDRWLCDQANGVMSVRSAVLPKYLGAAPKERIYVFSPHIVRANRVHVLSTLPFSFDRRLIKL
jgi:acylphosphatase